MIFTHFHHFKLIFYQILHQKLINIHFQLHFGVFLIFKPGLHRAKPGGLPLRGALPCGRPLILILLKVVGYRLSAGHYPAGLCPAGGNIFIFHTALRASVQACGLRLPCGAYFEFISVKITRPCGAWGISLLLAQSSTRFARTLLRSKSPVKTLGRLRLPHVLTLRGRFRAKESTSEASTRLSDSQARGILPEINGRRAILGPATYKAAPQPCQGITPWESGAFPAGPRGNSLVFPWESCAFPAGNPRSFPRGFQGKPLVFPRISPWESGAFPAGLWGKLPLFRRGFYREKLRFSP